MPESVAPDALDTPVFTRLRVVPSTFKEDLPKTDFVGEAVYEYPVITASHKATEVYERLVNESPEHPPDLVIAADTVVIAGEHIMEKPLDKVDNLRMLADLSGKSVGGASNQCTVMTGVAFVHPILSSPGFKVRTLCEQTRVKFAEIPAAILDAYVESGEGHDRAGGFAIQGKGAMLIKGIEGDYNNVVGFPLFSFIDLLHELVDDGELDLEGTGM